MKPHEYVPLDSLDIETYESLIELGLTLQSSAGMLNTAINQLFQRVQVLEAREQVLLARIAVLNGGEPCSSPE